MSSTETSAKLKNAVAANDCATVEAVLAQADPLVLQLLCEWRNRYNALYLAAERGNCKIAKLLIDAKANVNQQCVNGDAPLLIAATNGHLSMVELLLAQPDIDVEISARERGSPLHWASRGGHTAVALLLLDAKAPVDARDAFGKTPLWIAARQENLELTRQLLARNADVDAQDRDGAGSLMMAVRLGAVDIVQVLLAGNAKPDLRAKHGVTPLMTAVDVGSVACMNALLAAGAAVYKRDAGGLTALHSVALRGRAAMIAPLVEAGCKVHAYDKEGWTPLMRAANYGHSECVASLVALKADLNAGNLHGDTALIMALRSHYYDTFALLMELGADWRKKGFASVRQLAQRACPEVQALFYCPVCHWDGRCCAQCRLKYCSKQCDKFGAYRNRNNLNCVAHRKVAHRSVVEWALAVAPLQLPAYVVEHVFACFDLHPEPSTEDYQARQGVARIFLVGESSARIDENFVHLIVAERTHQENIAVFISVQQAYQRRKASNTELM